MGAVNGTLTWELRKCSRTTCCKPLRSNYKQYCRTGRMPTPTLFKRKENGHIVAVKPTENVSKDKSVRFGDFMLNLLYSPAANLSVDTYRIDISKKKRAESTCGVCYELFPNKTLMEAHRIACHYRNKGVEVTEDMIDIPEDEAEYDLVGDDALCILTQRNGLYKVKYNNETTEWMDISSSHPLVIEYENDKKEEEQKNNVENDELPIITKDEYQKWVKSQFPDEIVYEEDLIDILWMI